MFTYLFKRLEVKSEKEITEGFYVFSVIIDVIIITSFISYFSK